jgi:hypothetical protein
MIAPLLVLTLAAVPVGTQELESLDQTQAVNAELEAAPPPPPPSALAGPAEAPPPPPAPAVAIEAPPPPPPDAPRVLISPRHAGLLVEHKALLDDEPSLRRPVFLMLGSAGAGAAAGLATYQFVRSG